MDAHYATTWAYDDLGRLAVVTVHEGDDPVDPGDIIADRARTYAYDPIGNRLTSGEAGGDDASYTRNNLNQYPQVAWPSGAEAFTYDADGNLTGDAERGFAWDNENRLWIVSPKNAGPGDVAWMYRYDYLGRRVRKIGLLWDPDYNGGQGGWDWTALTPKAADIRYVYDGWNLVMELDGMNDNAVIRTYTWGLDLAGQSRDGAFPSRDREGAGFGMHAAGGDDASYTRNNLNQYPQVAWPTPRITIDEDGKIVMATTRKR